MSCAAMLLRERDAVVLAAVSAATGCVALGLAAVAWRCARRRCLLQRAKRPAAAVVVSRKESRKLSERLESDDRADHDDEAASVHLPVAAMALPPPPPPPPPLPEEFRQLPPMWEAHHASDGQIYFYNTETGASAWEPPRASPQCQSCR